MAEPLSPSHLSAIASFKNEWSALLECTSPAHDRKRLAGALRSMDWTRLRVLAEEHGETCNVGSCLRTLDENFGPPESRQTPVHRARDQIICTLRRAA